jgi:hypothetical protein
MPGALTHIRNTWSLSPMVHKSQVSLRGPPCAHSVAGTPHREVCDNGGLAVRPRVGEATPPHPYKPL